MRTRWRLRTSPGVVVFLVYDALSGGRKQGYRNLAERCPLGYQPSGDSRTDYVEPLGNLKTAWDLITFTGFLGL